jgi:soluble lytic murein transglycosylase-like protein
MLLAALAMATDPTDGMISTASALTQEYDLPAGLLLAVAEVESDFNPDCRTGKCHGLMQIHSGYAKEYAALAGLDSYDLFDYRDSMRIGAAMLADYIDRYEGDLHFALMCYNLGEWGAKAKRKDGVETTGYSRKVVGKIERYAVLELVEVPEEPVEAAEMPVPAESDALTPCITGVHQWLREVLFR